MKRCGRRAVLMWALSWLAACAPMKRAVEPTTSLPAVDWAAKINQADSLFAKGHYTAIKDALRIYKDALEVPAWRAAVAEEYVRSAIAYRQGRLDDAEKDLRASLDIEPSGSDAAYYLGRLYADRKEWLNSGVYFAGAAFSLEEKERGMGKKIEEIEASEMTAERKARLVVKKRVQILSVQATKATCQYNGAAGFHNAGVFERALDLARLAAAHPAFADKAAELIKLIRDR